MFAYMTQLVVRTTRRDLRLP